MSDDDTLVGGLERSCAAEPASSALARSKACANLVDVIMTELQVHGGSGLYSSGPPDLDKPNGPRKASVSIAPDCTGEMVWVPSDFFSFMSAEGNRSDGTGTTPRVQFRAP